MTLSARSLLHDLDGLPYPARQKLVSATAREAAPADLDRLLDELYDGGTYERLVGLQAATVVRHAGHIARSLDAPDAGVSVRAAVLAVRLGVAEDALLSRITSLPTAHRSSIYRAARRHGSTRLAEALLPIVRRTFGDDEAVGLLALCSSATCAELLPALGYAFTGWARLAQQHPDVFIDHVDTELATTPSAGWAELMFRFDGGLAAAMSTRPGRVLAVLERTALHAVIPPAVSRRISALARFDPDRLLRIVLLPGRPGELPGGRALWRALLPTADADLIRLGRALGPGTLGRFLHVLPPLRRAAVYHGIVGDRDLRTAAVPFAVLDELPLGTRGEVARTLLGQRGVADDPLWRLAVTARLPWPDAEPVLRSATRRATADERAEAYPLYIAAAANTRDRAVIEQMVASLTRLPNEQEPVRLPAVQALAEIPAWRYTPTAADGVAAVLTAVAQARDVSWQSRSAIRSVADALVREGAVSDRLPLIDIGMKLVELLGSASSSPNLHFLNHTLPRGAEHRVFEALHGRITADARRGRFSLALALARGLGRRAWDVPELQAFVDRARGAKDDLVVRTAVELWLEPPATRDERVETTLRADRSTISIPAVQYAVGFRRTDLLDDVLTKPLHGRFLARRIRHVPFFHGCFDRWLPRQRARYVDLLVELASASDASAWERSAAVRQLGHVPAAVERIATFLDSADPQIVDAALTALGRVDEPAQALPLLVRFATGDRAHVAMATATRCARYVAPDEVAAAVAPALRGRKIAGTKAAILMLAENHSPEAMPLLDEVWASPGQHRDVRRAVVSATRWLLEDERSWALLAEAAAIDELAPSVLAIHTGTVPVQHRGRFAALVRTVAAAPDPDTALRGLPVLPRWARWDGGDGAGLLVRLVTDLGRTATWHEAVRALVATCEITAADVRLVEAAAGLVAQIDTDSDADATRDQPARQRLDALTAAVERSVGEWPLLRPGAARLVDTVAASEPCRDLAIRLAVTAVGWEHIEHVTSDVERVVALADRPVLAWEAARLVRPGIARVVRKVEAIAYEPAVRTLLADRRAAANLIAVSILDVVGEEAGWPDTWRSLLRGCRTHDDADVRLAATRIRTVRE